MPLYEVVLEQRYYNQQIINRFNYLGSGTPAAVSMSFALLNAIGFMSATTSLPASSLGAAIQGLQNGAVTFVQAMARAVYVDEDFYSNPFLAGTVGNVGITGDTQSPVFAFGFRSNRVKQSIGRGYKRFVGMSEVDVDSAGLLAAGAVARAAPVVTELGSTATYDDEGNTLTFTPCIVQKELYTTPSGKDAYKYYATEVLQAPHIASGITWELYPQVRTQRSRQYGHGA